MNTLKKVTVIIPCRNEEQNIEKCIESIYNSDFDKAKLEVIIADGVSTDNTLSIINKLSKKYPELIVIENKKQITPVAFNIGLKYGTGEYLVTIGSRHFISQDYISKCVNILDTNQDIACVGGVSLCIESTTKGKIIANAMSNSFGVGGGNFRSQKTSGYVDTVGAPMYRKSVLEKIGYFDESLVRNQDDELSYRISKNGFKIFQSNEISVEYVTRSDFSKLFMQLFQYGYWKVLVNKKHKTITTFRQIIPPIFVVYLISALAILILNISNGYLVLIYLLPLIVYFIMALIVTVKDKLKISEIVLTIYCFIIMHISYGYGYLMGVVYFMILNRKPGFNVKKLTR